MFVQKIQISLVLIILAATLHGSEASMDLLELDSVGRIPEITVTAPRYEYQDEAWLGMVEGVVVEAQGPSNGRNETAAGDKSTAIVGGSMSSKNVESTSIRYGDSVYLLVSLTLTLATLSILYLSLGTYRATTEAKHDGTKH
ncbi:MAG: hypothetical protein WBE28_07050 [bacterium]